MFFSLNDNQNDSLFKNFFHFLIFCVFIYYKTLITFFILTTICLIDYQIRCTLKKKKPVKVNSICLGFSTNNWFILSIFSEIINELTKITVLVGILTIVVQYVSYPDKPTKQFKAVPSNIIFISGSIITNLIYKYNNFKYEKKYNTRKIKIKDKGYKKISDCNYGDIYIIENKIIPINCELYSESKKKIKLNMVKITGEEKPITKECMNIKLSNEKKIISYTFDECKKNKNIVPENSIILENIDYKEEIYGKIIKVSNENKISQTLPEFINYIENIKKSYIYLAILLGMFINLMAIFLVDKKNKNFTVIYIQSFISSQILIPLSYQATLIVLFTFINRLGLLKKLNNLSISIYERLPNKNPRFLITDKTGTLTKQGFIVRRFISNYDCLNCYHALLCDSDLEELEEKTMIDYVIRSYNMEYELIKKDNYLLKKINGKKYHTIRLGLFYSISGTLTLINNVDDNTYQIIYQGAFNDKLKSLSKINIDLSNIREKYNLDYNNPIRDWIHAETKIFNQKEFKNLEINSLLITQNMINNRNFENEQSIIEDLVIKGIFDSMKICDIFLMDNLLREGAKEAIQFFNNGYNSIICTGDNPKNAEIVAKCLGQSNGIDIIKVNNELEKINFIPLENYTYIFTKSTHFDILDKILDSKINSYILFSECTPNDKSNIVEKFKSKNFNVMFTGDGANDIQAMKLADLGICFPANDNTFLEELSSISSATTLDFTDGHFWKDWSNLKFEQDINLINNCMLTLLYSIILKCNTKSSIQLGSFLATNIIFDPVPNILYDGLFDLVIFFMWVILPIFKNYYWNKKNKIYNYSPFKLGFISYIFGTFISYLIYSNYDTELASLFNLFSLFLYQLLVICFL